MIGAIIGDIIGSTYEVKPKKTERPMDIDLFPMKSSFTDDTVLLVAIADSILYLTKTNQLKSAREQCNSFRQFLISYAKQYPNVGYGQMFEDWVYSEHHKPYKSYGNGSAMRAVAIGFMDTDLATIQAIAQNSSLVTHNHRLGMKGAKIMVTTIFLANQGESKDSIKGYLSKKFNLQCRETIHSIRQRNSFDSSAKASIPISIQCFLESDDFESAIRNCISVGGDADTIACMTGAIAQAFYKKIPTALKSFAYTKIDATMKNVVAQFESLCKINTELS